MTVSTANYRRHTERLLHSLNRTNKNFCLLVYCDQRDEFADLEAYGNCRVVELPSIRQWGVKRAKFEAYHLALKQGSFLYLDSDIIVLEDLSALFGGKRMAGCFDALDHCPFIEDRRHPWVQEPSLVSEVYINSGVFFLPRSDRKLADRLYQESLNDEVWNRYIIPGKLYDNHFLCAFMNKWSWPLQPWDPEVYNWPGFFGDDHQSIRVYRTGDGLASQTTGKPLALVHFAGIMDIDEYVGRLPLPVASLLAKMGCPPNEVPKDELFRGLVFADGHFQRAGGGLARGEPWTVADLQGAPSIVRVLASQRGERWSLGEKVELPVVVKNLSDRPLVAGPDLPIWLAYHWRSSQGDVVTWDGVRTGLLPVMAGAEVNDRLHVIAPTTPGRYVLEVTLVVEGHFWLENLDPQVPARVSVEVADTWAAVDRLKGRITQYLQHGFLDKSAQRSSARRSARPLPTTKRAVPVIVSLTSFPPRIHDVDLCVLSLLNQTEKPDLIVLNLAEEEFPQREADLPARLLDLRSMGLEIRWCENWKAHKKLIPTLMAHPDAVIITVDDDSYYSPDLVASLYGVHLGAPQDIVCRRMHRVAYRETGVLAPYGEWTIQAEKSEDDFRNFPTGVGGVLYPPGSLAPQTVDPALFWQLCPWNDDLWFWAMGVLAGTKVRLVGNGQEPLTSLDIDRDLGYTSGPTLAKVNVTRRGNEDQLKELITAFPVLRGGPQGLAPGQRSCVVTLNIGQRPFFAHTRPALQSYAARCGATFVEVTELSLPPDLLGRVETLNARRPAIGAYVAKLYSVWQAFEQGYDRVLLLDDSCLVLDHTPDLFAMVPDGTIAAYREGDEPELAAPGIGRQFLTERRNVTVRDNYNAGVVLVTRAWHELFSPVELAANVDLFEGPYPVQAFLDYQIHRHRVPVWELSHRWNYMPIPGYSDPANRGLGALASAYIDVLSQQNIVHVTGYFEHRGAIIEQLASTLPLCGPIQSKGRVQHG